MQELRSWATGGARRWLGSGASSSRPTPAWSRSGNDGVPVRSHAEIVCTSETHRDLVKMTAMRATRSMRRRWRGLIRAAVALYTSTRAAARPVRSEAIEEHLRSTSPADPRRASLTAGDAHVALEGGALVAAVDHEVVALGLARDALQDRGAQQLVALRGAQGGAQIRLVLLAQAHVHPAGAGHAHPVARFAEVVGERRDEAEP